MSTSGSRGVNTINTELVGDARAGKVGTATRPRSASKSSLAAAVVNGTNCTSNLPTGKTALYST